MAWIKKSSEEVPGQGRSVVPRLRRKQKSQNDLSIGNLVLSLEGSADSERRLIYCVDCDSPNWPHFQFYILFQSLATPLSRGRIYFPLKLGEAGPYNCLDKQNMTDMIL